MVLGLIWLCWALCGLNSLRATSPTSQRAVTMKLWQPTRKRPKTTSKIMSGGHGL